MVYSKRDDITVKKIGIITLGDQPLQKMHLELKRYKKGDIKLAILFENETLYGNNKGETYFTTKIPRLHFEDLKKLKEKLPKMLEEAYTQIDELS